MAASLVSVEFLFGYCILFEKLNWGDSGRLLLVLVQLVL